MTGALIKKEIRQHFYAFLMLFIFAVLAFIIMYLGTAVGKDKTNILEVLSNFLLIFSSFIAIILCRRLVVIEYANRTQYFLESLPISRFNFYLTKYLLGLGLILLINGSVTAFCLISGTVTKLIDPLFAGIISLRMFLFILFIYNFFHMMAYTGRYRFGIYTLLFLLYFFLDTNSSLELERIGPFALIDSTFAYERFTFPITNGLITIMTDLILLFISFVLALYREGSIASIFSSKMSHKEKIIVTIVCLLFLFTILTFDEKKTHDPFNVPGAVEASGNGVTIKIVGDSDHKSEHQILADYFHNEFVLMRKYLGIQSLNPIFIIQNETLLPMIHKPVSLENTDGSLFYTNLNHSDWVRSQFESYLIRKILLNHTAYQAGKEKNFWVLTGFAETWSNRDLNNEAIYELRAAYGSDNLESWFTGERHSGLEIMHSTGWSGIRLLFKTYSGEKVKEYLQRTLGTSHSRDLRALFTSRSTNSERAFELVFSSEYSEFMNLWSEYLQELKIQYKEELKELQRIDTEVTVKPISENSRSAFLEINTSEQSTPDDRFYCFYNKLIGIKNFSNLYEMEYFEEALSSGNLYEIPEYFSPGDRLDYFVLLYSKKLKTYISSPAYIEEIK